MKKKKKKCRIDTFFRTLNIRFPSFRLMIIVKVMSLKHHMQGRGNNVIPQSVSIRIWRSIYDQVRYYTYNSIDWYREVYPGWHACSCIMIQFISTVILTCIETETEIGMLFLLFSIFSVIQIQKSAYTLKHNQIRDRM